MVYGRFDYDETTNSVGGPGEYMAARGNGLLGRIPVIDRPMTLLVWLQTDFEEWSAREPVQWVGGVGGMKVISR